MTKVTIEMTFEEMKNLERCLNNVYSFLLKLHCTDVLDTDSTEEIKKEAEKLCDSLNWNKNKLVF